MSPDSGRVACSRNLRSQELENFRPKSRLATVIVTAPATAVILPKKRRRCRFAEDLLPVWPPGHVASAATRSLFAVAVAAAATYSSGARKHPILSLLSPTSSSNNYYCSSDEVNELSSETVAMNMAAARCRSHVSVSVEVAPRVISARTGRVHRGTRSFFSRMAAAIALVGAALLSSNGVHASSMTQELCTGMTLYYTELELEESPRLDTSTEAVAVGIDGTIVASQDTYERLLLDREAITVMSGVDVPFRNRWSDRLWIGTVKVTFTGATALADLDEGSPPDFNCMKDHYGMSFEKGDAGSDFAEGTLTSEKVLNWDLLEPEYTSLESITAFEPTSELVVRSTTNLVATREDLVAGRSRNGSYHYFLSVPSSEVDSLTCPEPCTGEIITYYSSFTGGYIYQLDKTSSDADPPACWLPLFEEVADGPPLGGPTSWDLDCITTLLDRVEEEETSRIFGAASSGDARTSDAVTAIAAGVLVPVVLAACVGVLFLLQRRQRAKKMKTTDEAWGEGRDGCGEQQKVPSPPTGKFKLGPILPPSVADDSGNGDDFPTLGPPTRAFTDISVGSEECDGGRRTQSGDSVEARLEDDIGSGDMMYPLDV